MNTRAASAHVFLGADAVAAGSITPAQLRGPRVQRVVRGVYCPAGVRLTHPVRCEAAAMLALESAVITGASALTLHGVPLAEPTDPVHLVVPHDEQFVLGRDVVVHRRVVQPEECRPWHDRRLATPLRATVDLLLGRQPLDSVPYLDRVLRSGLVGQRELGAHLAGRHERGVVLARRAVELADDRAESPRESWMRVALVLGGLEPEPQLRIHDARGFVARVDLAFPARRLAVEYEGAHHGEASMLVPDRERLDRLREAGWQVLFVTVKDTRRPPPELVARVRAALEA